jgi:REP element-mobilizing transposase RayT
MPGAPTRPRTSPTRVKPARARPTTLDLLGVPPASPPTRPARTFTVGVISDTHGLIRPKNKHFVQQTMRRFARRFGIRIYEFANAGNHVHLLLRTKCRFAIQNFLRAFAGLIARFVTGACKGFSVGKFWDELAYSRIVTWGRDFIRVRSFVVQKRVRGLGVSVRQAKPSARGFRCLTAA